VVDTKVHLGDGQRALVQEAGAVEVTLVANDEGEVVEISSGIRIVRAEEFLADGEGTLTGVAGLRIARPDVQVAGRAAQH
jgi:hypothetical protein